MRKYIMCVIVLCCAGLPDGALASKMCIKKNPGKNIVLTNPERVTGNRGTFIFEGAYMGESHCSVAGIVTDSRFEEFGGMCWCRVTKIAAPNGYMATHYGPWIYMSYSTVNGCATGCSAFCGAYRTSTRAMLTSIK